MSRPTPEELVNDLTRQGAFPTDLMDVLGRFGYVIVHADDQRARDEAIIRATWNLGRPAAPRRASALIDAIIADAEQEQAS